MMDIYCAELTRKSRKLLPGHLKHRIEPGDVVQEVFQRALTVEGRFSGRTEAEIRAYLIRTLRSVIQDLVRRFDRGKRRMSCEGLTGSAGDAPSFNLESWLVADQTSPSRKAGRNEQLAKLARALAALPPDQREAVELHHLKGLALEKTAEAMGKSRPAVAGLLRRGLTMIREQLVEIAE
jgi:RNA polymerase sigma-70 factor (ECF subfamily)